MKLKEYNHQRTCADKSRLCHAPSYSMHFAKNGLVSVCSYTRFAPIGKYPDQSIEEIWYGQKADEMRKAMRGDQFPAGCFVCSSDANSGSYSQMRAARYDQFAAGSFERWRNRLKNKIRSGVADEYPKVLTFELSNTCNLECVMCMGMLSSSIRQNRDRLPPLPQVYGKEFIQQLRPFIPHLKEAQFFGGEPFLIDLYLEIWDLFTELNPDCKIYITTNGTIFNNRVRNILSRLRNFQLVVSLDAISAPVYHEIRVNGNFGRVMENVQQLKEISQKQGRRITISPTYMTLNRYEYPLLLDFANREGLQFETNILTTPHELSLINLPLEELKNVLAYWTDHIPHPAETPELGENNGREFEKARHQVEVWVKEQEQAFQDPIGKKLSGFVPANKMEDCLLIILRHSIRTSRDPSLPLQLARLWKEGGEAGKLLIESAWNISQHLFPEKMRGEAEVLQQQLAKTYASLDKDKQMNMVQSLLANEENTCKFILSFSRGDVSMCISILQEAQKRETYQVAEEDFF